MNRRSEFSTTKRRDKWRILSIVLALLLVSVIQGNVVYGQEQTPLTLTVDGSSSRSIAYKTNKEAIKVAPALTLTGGSANEKISQAKVYLSGIKGRDFTAEDRLGLEGQTGVEGQIGNIQWSYDEANGTLTFSGEDTPANYQAVLRLVTYTYTNQNSPRPKDRTIEFAIGSSLYNEDNGHFYEFIQAKDITWANAKAEAEKRAYLGRQGYLATITSEQENNFVAGKLKGRGWMGASDADHDKQWYWVTGPEKDTWFFTQKGYKSPENIECGTGPASEDLQPKNANGKLFYHNWSDGEPNDALPNKPLGCANNEDYAHFLENGKWNDYPNDPKAVNNPQFYRVDGYVVEYGGMPADKPVDSSLTGKVTISYLRCNGCGDVHILTYDGLKYDFQATGEFLAVRSSNGKVVVQARQETYPVNPKVSVNTAVAFMVDGDKLEFYVKPKTVFYINDVETELPSSSMTLPKGGRIDPWFGGEYYITWPDGRFAARVMLRPNESKPDASYLDYGVGGHGDTFEGLMGNFDGNPRNDLQLNGGGDPITPPPSIADLNRFGDSWRVPPAESLFRDVEGVKEQPHTLVVIEKEKKEEARKTCQDGGVTHEAALKNCVYDVASTGDPNFVKSAKDVEDSVKDLPPDKVVPAAPEDTLKGPIFDAAQADLAGISIKDGDDLIVTTGESADGKPYLRFQIFHNGEYVTSFSVGVDATIADAVAQGLVAKVKAELPAQPEEEVGSTTTCSDAVQGKIAWNYQGNTTWNPANIERLCKGAETSVEPALCFQKVMHGGVNWGGGTEWSWGDALDLCEGTLNAADTISCFESAIASGASQQEAISKCNNQ